MNMYFNDESLNTFKHVSSDIKILKNINDQEVELLLTNLNIGQIAGKVEKVYRHRPMRQDFKINQELIFSGCSETQGNFICGKDDVDEMYKNIWGFILSDNLNLDSINLGIGGESAYRIIQRLMSHFRYYGNPKNLMCLFPDPYRFTSPIEKDHLEAKKYVGNFLQTTHHNNLSVPKTALYAKKPFMKEDVIPKSFPIFFNFQAILMIEDYCASAGINFLWGSWNKDTNIIVKIINSKIPGSYKNFVDLSVEDDQIKDKECHAELYRMHTDLYFKGSDGIHKGLHYHAHAADKFLKEYNSRF